MKKILVLLFSLILVFSLMFNSGCNTVIDITGTWNVTYHIVGIPIVGLLTFNGSKTAGTVSTIFAGEIGTYEVSGDDVIFTAQIVDSYNDALLISASGKIKDKNNMDGNFTYHYSLLPNITLSGTWAATR